MNRKDLNIPFFNIALPNFNMEKLEYDYIEEVLDPLSTLDFFLEGL